MSRAAKILRVASVNVNGIRAAYRKDMATWLAGRDVDILCLQEVRAPDKIVRELLNEDDWKYSARRSRRQRTRRGIGGNPQALQCER